MTLIGTDTKTVLWTLREAKQAVREFFEAKNLEVVDFRENDGPHPIQNTGEFYCYFIVELDNNTSHLIEVFSDKDCPSVDKLLANPTKPVQFYE